MLSTTSHGYKSDSDFGDFGGGGGGWGFDLLQHGSDLNTVNTGWYTKACYGIQEHACALEGHIHIYVSACRNVYLCLLRGDFWRAGAGALLKVCAWGWTCGLGSWRLRIVEMFRFKSIFFIGTASFRG